MVTSVSCSSCHFPIAAHGEKEAVHCPFCGQKGETVYGTKQVGQRISRVSGAADFSLGMVVGVIFSVPIIAAIKASADALARLAKEKIR